MSESERNDLDDAIDRAARQLVVHEPPPRLYAAVMADIRAGSEVRQTPSPWTTWRWALAGMFAAAILAVTVLVWRTQQPAVSPAVFPGLPAPPQVARIAPPPEAVATVAPKPPSPSPARRRVGRTDVAHPQIAQAAVAGSAIDVKSIQVATIPVAGISVGAIPVSTIPVAAIADDDPISVNTIGTDAK
jgi:hypothetical protein